MPSFSFTAPIVTAEQEMKEVEELDEEERERIRMDVHGCVVSYEQPKEFAKYPQSGREECSIGGGAYEAFQQEMMEIADKDKKDFLEALKVVPNLVATESNPSRFLQTSPSPAVAARRVAQYWKNRRKLFGASAFLPMTQDGAMAGDGVSCLEKGFLNILPKDPSGRVVIFFDRIRAQPAVVSRDAVLKTIFYILQKASHQTEESDSTDDDMYRRPHLPQQPIDGFVMIENILGYDLYTHFDRIFTKTKMILFRECFPIELKVYHVWAGQSGAWAVDLIMPVIKQLAGKHIRLRMLCHAGHETLTTFCKTYNFQPKDMSVVIGGDYSYGDFLLWFHEERRRELKQQQAQQQ